MQKWWKLIVAGTHCLSDDGFHSTSVQCILECISRMRIYCCAKLEVTKIINTKFVGIFTSFERNSELIVCYLHTKWSDISSKKNQQRNEIKKRRKWKRRKKLVVAIYDYDKSITLSLLLLLLLLLVNDLSAFKIQNKQTNEQIMTRKL